MKKIFFPSDERGITELDWLLSKHSFSFGEYYDPKKTGFGKLLVVNDDTIAPGQGFGMHPHKDMEIITIVLDGMLEHKDSEGNKGQIKNNQIQLMSAGTGIMHSEFNASKKDEVSLLQIWINTNKNNTKPSYQDMNYKIDKNNITTLVSEAHDKDKLHIQQNATLSLLKLDKGKIIKHNSKINGVYFFVIEGSVNILDQELNKRDALGVVDSKDIEIKTLEASYILIIEVDY